MAIRNKHSLSYTHLLSMNQGALVPVGLTEVLLGDSIQQASNILLRVSPLVTPVMHPVTVQVAHFYVPHRIIWEDFEDFITGGPDGLDASVFPTITFGGGSGAAVGSLADYLGVPPGVNNLEVSALPVRAYQLIFREWFRDQDLVTAPTIDITSGADTTTTTTLQFAGWEKDYFTTARPWEQKGPSITIPLGTEAPVKGIGVATTQTWATSATVRESPGAPAVNYTNATRPSVDGNFYMAQNGSSGYPDVYADLSNASAVTVNLLREALALQRFEEARSRFGSRYTEYLRYLGVHSSDGRLQRPELLATGRATVQFSEVLQTAPSDIDDTPTGEMKGHGMATLRSNRYRRFFEEHGYVITLMWVRPKTIYGQGLFRTWNRRTKEDFWQRELEHIGQQPILNKELYAPHASPNGTFGYQDRYDEYRRSESRISGEFRTVLDSWHMARIFASDPALNSTFVSANPTDRIYASTNTDELYIYVKHSIQARRLVAKTGSSFIF